jgi:hypothetical protein
MAHKKKAYAEIIDLFLVLLQGASFGLELVEEKLIRHVGSLGFNTTH